MNKIGHRIIVVYLINYILFMPFASTAMAQDEERKETLAVVQLQAQGISEQEAGTLTNWLQVEIANLGVYQVVERGQMDMILEEQGFQLSGCTSGECIVEIGMQLGAEKMVAGSVGKIGKTYTLDLRLFSVESGAIVSSSKQSHKGEVEGLLVVIENIAKELIIGKEEKKKKHWGRRILLFLLASAAASAYMILNQDPAATSDPIPNPPGFPTIP